MLLVHAGRILGRRPRPAAGDLTRLIATLLLDAGLPVVAFRDNPRFPYDMFERVETYGADHPRCDEPRPEALLEVNPLLEVAARHEGLQVVDLTDRLCTAEVCPSVVGDVVVYRDLDHVTSGYGATLTPDVEERLTSTLGW